MPQLMHSHRPIAGEGEHETQVSVVQWELAPDPNGDSNGETIEDLLTQPPKTIAHSSFAEEQRKMRVQKSSPFWKLNNYPRRISEPGESLFRSHCLCSRIQSKNID